MGPPLEHRLVVNGCVIDMMYNTFARYPFLAEYWGYTIETDGAGNQTRIYAFARNVPVNMRADGSGRTFFFTRDALMLRGAQIRSVTRKVDSKVILSTMLEISVQEPILSNFDNDVTYKYWALEVAPA